MLFLLSKGGESIINKIKLLYAVCIVIIVTVTSLLFIDGFSRTEQPNNHMIEHELVIHNTGKFSNLYVDEINSDRGNQPFGLSYEVKSEDLHLYVLAHETSEQEVNEYVKWIISYYGAEEIKQ